MKTASTKLTNITARQKLPKQKRPYYISVADRLCLGYVVRRPKVGTWVGRMKTMNMRGYYDDCLWKIGEADDERLADGTTVLTYGQAFAKAAEGPPQSSRATPYSVKDAIYDYFTHRQGKKGLASRRDAESKLSKVLAHPIAAIELNTLTRADLHRWQAAMVEYDAGDPDRERRSKDSCNRILRDLRAALNLAADNSKSTHVLTNTEWGRKFKELTHGGASPTRAREWNFEMADVRRLIEAAAPDFRAVITTLIYTGARPGDVGKVRVKHFDLAHRELTIPTGKTKERTTTLTVEACEYFRGLAKDRLPDAWLVTKADGTPWTAEDQALSMRAAVLAAGLVASEAALDALPRRSRPVPYSLRHAYVSRSIEQGLPLLVIAQNIGNSVAMVEKHYAKILARSRRDMIEQGAPSLRAEGMAHA